MKTQLSYKNHFQFGYNEKAFNFRATPEDRWWVTYGKCDRQPLTFKDECIATAKKIAESAGGTIWILFSGGADSEVALQSFLLARIPISVAILRFNNDLNAHDISYAISFCEKNGLKYYFFDLDIVRFWSDRLFEFAQPTYCVSPQLLSTMWLMDQVDGYPVLGSGECYLVKRTPPDYIPGVSEYLDSEWDLFEKEKIAAWYRHLILRGRDGCPGFFQYTPEIILSYLRDPLVKKLTTNQIHGKLSTTSTKLQIYQQHFNLVDRPKYSGFEKVQNLDGEFRKKLVEQFSFADQIAKTPILTLEKEMAPVNLWGKKV